MPKVEVYAVGRKLKEMQCDQFEPVDKYYWCKKSPCQKIDEGQTCFLKGYYGKTRRKREIK